MNLSNLDLRGMDISNAQIGSVNFGATNLTDVRFNGATGVPGNINLAIFQSTTCPDGTITNEGCW